MLDSMASIALSLLTRWQLIDPMDPTALSNLAAA
jgi:hypothetical protein